MATTTSGSNLDEWLSEVYGIVDNVKTIIASDGTGSQTSLSSGSMSATTAVASGTSEASTPSQTQASETSGANPSVTSAQPTAAPSSGSPTSNSITRITLGGSSAPNQAQATSPSSASTDAAASSGNRGRDILPIVLGAVLGGVALILLGLMIWFWVRRRRAKRNRPLSSNGDDDDVASWHGPDRLSQQPMISAPVVSESPFYSSNRPPSLSQHPAYRGIITGSSNPFVPPVPAPRRSKLNGSSSPIVKDTMTGDDSHAAVPLSQATDSSASRVSPSGTSSSPEQRHHDPLSTGVAGLAAGVAAHKIRRKPINSQGSDLASPIEAYSGYGWGNSASEPAYGHTRNQSNQPLMSDNTPASPYTEERPATPFGLMAFGGKNGKAKDEHTQAEPPMSPTTPTSPNRESYQSFTMRPTPSHPHPSSHRENGPDTYNPHSPRRRVSFPDPIEGDMSPGAYRHSRSPRNSSGNGSANNYSSPTAIGYTDYAYPLQTTHSAGAGQSPPASHRPQPPSSSAPKRPRYGYETSYEKPYDNNNNYGYSYDISSDNHFSQASPRQNRLRLRDILAQQEVESERLRVRNPKQNERSGYEKGRSSEDSGNGGVGVAL